MPNRMLIINEENLKAADREKVAVMCNESGLLHAALEENIQFTGGYHFTYANNDDGGHLKHIRKLQNGKFNEKNWIKNIFYRPVAEQLIEKFEELNHINPDVILFLEDMAWKKPKGKPESKFWIAQTKLTNSYLYSMTGYIYQVQIRNYFVDKMSKEQVVATLYHQLRHIGQDGNIEPHDAEDWSVMLATLGKDWATTKAQIVDLLSDQFNGWEELRRIGSQISMFDNGGKVVNFHNKN